MALEALQPNLYPGSGIRVLSARFWALVALTGIGAGIAAGALMQLLRAVQHVSWAYSSGTFLDAVERHGAAWRVLVLLAAGVVAGIYRWLMKLNPGGHGGELAARLWFHSGRVPALPTLSRAVLSIVLVGMGVSLGREAAPKQAGAVVASLLSAWGRLSPAERRLLAACGAGAGMGAVYNVPFGGALFALEVLLGTLALPLVPPVLACSLIATGVSWLVMPADMPAYRLPTYHIPAYHVAPPTVVWALWAGPLAGLAAILYIRAIAWADARKPKGWPRLAVPILVFAALGGLAVPFPQLLGNGRDIVQQMFTGRVGLPLLLAVAFLKPAATTACLGSGAPGGLFTPTMAYGAAVGGVLGVLWGWLWPGAPLGAYAVIGSAAVLAAAMQGPIASLVLVLELVHHFALALPLMLAILGAVGVARRFEPRSIYSGRIHLGQQAADDKAPPRPLAFADLVSRAFEPISAATPYPEILREIVKRGGPSRGSGAGPLYVVDEEGRLVGAISAEKLCEAGPENPLLETAVADDLAVPVEPVRSSDSREEALRRLAAEGGPLPVVDADSGAPIGVARPPEKD